jgi:hypothetical protein
VGEANIKTRTVALRSMVACRIDGVQAYVAYKCTVRLHDNTPAHTLPRLQVIAQVGAGELVNGNMDPCPHPCRALLQHQETLI